MPTQAKEELFEAYNAIYSKWETLDIVPKILISLIFILLIVIVIMVSTYKSWNKTPKITANMSVAIIFMILLFAFACSLLFFPQQASSQIVKLYSIFENKYNKSTLLFYFLIVLFIIIVSLIATYKQWDKTPKTAANTSIAIVFMILLFLFAVSYYFFPKQTTQNVQSIGNVPSTSYQLLQYRGFKYKLAYFSLFCAFVLLCIILNGINPYNITTKYFGFTTFIILFVACFFAGVLFWYIYNYNYNVGAPRPVWNFFLNTIYILFSLGLSTALIAWTVISIGSFNTTANIISLLGNIALIVVLFAIVYRMIDVNSYVRNSPIVRLLLNSIFYIPCLLVNILEFLYQSNKNTNKVEITLFVLSILLILFLFMGVPYFEKKFYSQGGMQLLNEPVYLDNHRVLSDYSKLNPKKINPSDASNNIYEYNYGLSMWIYIDSNNKTDSSGNIMIIKTDSSGNVTTSLINSYKSIFDYGGKPSIYYDASNNKMSILEVSKKNPDNPDVTVIYEKKNLKLQKWNHVILNYNGGTLDIFYNGKLVKSQPNVLPYMEMDALTVGSTHGTNGAICNINYFNHTLNTQQIYYLYNSVKNSTPPIITTSIINTDYNKSQQQGEDLTTGIIVTSVASVVSILGVLMYTS